MKIEIVRPITPDTPFTNLALFMSSRTYFTLMRAGITSLRDLTTWTEKDLLGIEKFGVKGLQEIKAVMVTASVSFKRRTLSLSPKPKITPKTSILSLELPSRVTRLLDRGSIFDLEDLRRIRASDLLTLRGFGRTSLEQVKEIMAKARVRFKPE